MNVISRLLRGSRFKLFAAATVDRLELLSPADRAAALVQAVAYCLELRRHGATEVSMALLRTDRLSINDCRDLFHGLEEPYFHAESSNVSTSEYSAIAGRYGKDFANDYRRTAEAGFRVYAFGLAILMSRLSHRAARQEPSALRAEGQSAPYTRIADCLVAALPLVDGAIRLLNRQAEAANPEKVWSRETMQLLSTNASVIATTFPD